jgi:transposase InsO family protein
MAQQRGTLPLVHAMDNGSPYCEGETRRWLAERRVLVLRSLSHMPQHNAFAERANGELKAESGLASDTVLASTQEASVALKAACMRLNVARCRGSRGGRTARELDQVLPRADPKDARRSAATCRQMRNRFVNTTGVIGAGRVAREARVSELPPVG